MDDIFSKIGLQFSEDDLNVTEVIPTGIIPLDITLGVGGFPRGRLSCLLGAPGLGKSSISIMLARSNAQLGGETIIIDAEQTYEKYRMAHLGLSDETLKHIHVLRDWGVDKKTNAMKPLTMETIGNKLVEIFNAVSPSQKLLVIWDTISATPLNVEFEIEKDMDKYMGKASRVLSHFFRLLPPLLPKKNATLLCVVQPKIDLMNHGATTYLGEKPIRFHSSVIVQLTKMSQDEKRINVVAKLTKNKVATSFKKTQLVLYTTQGAFDQISNQPEFIKGNGYLFGNTSVKGRKDWIQIVMKEQEAINKFVSERLERPIPYKITVPDFNFLEDLKEIDDEDSSIEGSAQKSLENILEEEVDSDE